MSTDGMSSTNTTATSTATSTATATATATSTTSTTVAETTGCTFVCPDVFAACPTPEDIQCDIWGWGDEDCCEGEKCNSWASDGSHWDSTKCVPVDPNPDGVGEPCTVVGSGVSGIDSCEKGAMCWDVDPETNVGVCVRLCMGDPRKCLSDIASCCPAGHTCTIAAASTLILCLQNCDPLLQDCEGQGDVCYALSDSFQCAPDQSADMGAVGDPCEFINACDPGNYCGDPPDYPGCDPNVVGCCIPFCPLDAPACAPGTECLPFFDPNETPAGYENLGVCVIPP